MQWFKCTSTYIRAACFFLLIYLLASCQNECNYSDDEIIELSISYILKNQPKSIYISSPSEASKKYDVVQYKSIEEFIYLNEKCCSVTDHLPDVGGPTVFEKLFYGFRGYVIVENTLRVASGGETKGIQISPYVTAVNTCGDRIDALNFWE